MASGGFLRIDKNIPIALWKVWQNWPKVLQEKSTLSVEKRRSYFNENFLKNKRDSKILNSYEFVV